MAGPTVRPATLEDVPALGAVWGRAFRDDPLWSWIVRDRPEERERRMTRFFTATARQWVRHSIREVWTTRAREGAAAWSPPGSLKEPAGKMLTATPAIVAALRGGLRRSLAVYALVLEHRPPEPHWYLEILGTDPASQGRGVATAVIGPVLERCDREGLPAYLETETEANVPFYERRGFRVTGEVDVPKGGPHMWLMLRPPARG